jgi:hypothetical protein
MKWPVLMVLGVMSWQGLWALSIEDPGQGSVRLPSGRTGAEELSGLTYAGGTTYYTVSDSGPGVLWVLDIAVDPANGRITEARVDRSLSMPGLQGDIEGVAYRGTARSVLVSDESNSTVREYSIASGKQIGVLKVPPIFKKIRNNFGLESLSIADGKLWTANEEALLGDGSRSTAQAGSWVRLQRFDRSGKPNGQWAYCTEPISQMSPFTTATRSGVSDLLALPGGGLLVLERELGGVVPEFWTRIYEVSFTGASDTSSVKSLLKERFRPAKKRLLWEHKFRVTNYEGITLGPTLADGSRSLLLISDDGRGQEGMTQHLYPLTLRLGGGSKLK